jgi:hypothetical protein
MTMSQVKGQEEKRRVEYFVDQHGREYVANVEKETGDPCEVLRALFQAPLGPNWFAGRLTPPAAYVKMVPIHERARRRHSVFVDYDKWLMDIDERNDAFEQKMFDFVRAATQGAGNIVEVVKNPPPVIRDLIGAAPFPPRVFVEAMAMGNRWALGQDMVTPVRVNALLDELKPQLVRSARKRGQMPTVDPFGEGSTAALDEPTLPPLSGASVTADPFASDARDVDDDENELPGGELLRERHNASNPIHSALDEISSELEGVDLEEQFDPAAAGGTTEKIPRRKTKVR